MKNIIKITILILTMAFFVNCQEDEGEIGDIIAPSNLVVTAEIVGVDSENPFGDGSGVVNFTASADNALSYSFVYGDGKNGVASSGVISHPYTENVGVFTYTAVISAIGTGGVSTSTSIEIEVFNSFTDLEAKILLSGGIGNSKTWYPKLDEDGHLGVGPTLAQDTADDGALNGHWFPTYDSTAAFGKCDDGDTDCFCNFTLSFSLDADENLSFIQDNNGTTFFNWASGSAVGQTFGEFEDTCFEFDTTSAGESQVSLAPSTTDWSQVADPNFTVPRGTVMSFSDDAFMGYYTGVSSYEILEIDNNYLYVRFFDNANPVLAWYQKFTTTLPSEEFDSIFTNLVWDDEFDVNGAPDAAKWTYDLGAGGWGNQEVQTYTNNAENVIVEDGFLKITAKANGSDYTSARLKSEDLYEFTYGRVEVRAKLPASIGTWPAIWALGEDYQTNTWPGCGEIDIMEQKGQDKNTVLATVHHPAVSPGAGDSASTNLSTSTTQFHNYTVEWRSDSIIFLVDDTVYHTVVNTPDLPFESDFFLILNVAMGGTLGGDIDPAFTEDSMEIDYVRVYQ